MHVGLVLSFRRITTNWFALQVSSSHEEVVNLGVPLALYDVRFPLCKVLGCAYVAWSAREVSRRFRTELEAGREALRINWSRARDVDPHRLRAMLSRLPRLESLDGSDCPPSHLASLALPQLTALKMSSSLGAPASKGLRGQAGGSGFLNHSRAMILADITPLASCTALLTLDLQSCKRRIDVAPLVSCKALRTLNLGMCHLVDVPPLASWTALMSLDLKNFRLLTDLTPLASCKALSTLNVSVMGITDLTPLASCKALSTLNVSATGIHVLSPLSLCPALSVLNMCKCRLLTDLTPLVSCKALSTLYVSETGILELSPLSLCPALSVFDMHGRLVRRLRRPGGARLA